MASNNKMKTTDKTKSTKPAFVVDLTNIGCLEDIKLEFILAKVRSGMPISLPDVNFLIWAGVLKGAAAAKEILVEGTTLIEDEKTVKKLVNILNEVKGQKKLPWYKRFWNWITRKK